MSGEHRVLREGLVVGLIAYVAVAAFYALFDLLAARGTLFTVSMLSQALFVGPPEQAVLAFPLEPDFRTIFWYNAFHLVASLLIGVTVVSLIAAAERRPSASRSRAVLVTIVAGYALTIVVVGVLSRTIRPVLPWWSIVTVNTLAVALAAWYLLPRHPGLVGRLLR